MQQLFLIPEASPLHRHRLGALTSLGRHPENTVEIPDRSVSKFHAQVQRRADGSHILMDLGSRNGTWVSGRRIEKHRLVAGEEVVLGTVRFRVHGEVEALRATGSLQIPEGFGTRGQITLQHRGTRGPAPVQLTDEVGSIEHSAAMEPGAMRFPPSDQVRDIEQLRRDYDKLRIAHELSSAIQVGRDLDDLLVAVVSRIFDLLPADRCAVLLMHEDGSSLEPRMVMERSGGAPSRSMPLSQTVLREVMTQKKAVLSTDAAADDRFQGAHSVVALSIRATMSVPLVYEDAMFGALHVDSLVASAAFTPKDLALFSAIANQTAAALKNASLVQEIQRESETRARLGRLLSPNLVEEVVAGKLDMSRGGVRRQAAVLFSDIRGFTSLSERMTAEQVTAMLNEYFEVMADVVFEEHGTLDKYLGDGMMALFGVPKDDPRAAERAVRCALRMQVALRSLNRVREGRGEPALEIGVGIHYGEVVWGAVGSRKTMDYTVIGDVVNTASRLCGSAAGGQVLVAAAVHAALPEGRFEVSALPPVLVKGKAAPVPVFAVLSAREALE